MSQTHNKEEYCLRVAEFRYPDSLNKKRPSLIYPTIPEEMQNRLEQARKQAHIQQKAMLNTCMQYRSASSNKLSTPPQYKTFITPRDQGFQPDKTIFTRFQYENYSNYSYKNPYKPQTPFSICLKEKSKPTLFSHTPDIEMVYCKNRIGKFQQIIADKLKDAGYGSHTKRSQEKGSALTKKKRAESLKIVRGSGNITDGVGIQKKGVQVEMKMKPKGRINRGNTNLANLIKQFNTLQKLTVMLQNISQPKISSQESIKDTEFSTAEKVSVEVLMHRFSWLKRLKKKVAERIFRVLGVLKEDELVGKDTKLGLNEYIDFVRLFVVRDASAEQLSYFLMRLLFQGKDYKQISLEKAEEFLDLLDGPESKHTKVRKWLGEYFAEKQESEGFQGYCEKEPGMMNQLIDLFLY